MDSRKSVLGYIFTFLGGVVSWKCLVQYIVALSTIEAMFIATTKVVKEAIWLQRLLKELGLPQESTKVFCDSQNAIYLMKNLILHARSKHIDAKLHFIRDIIENGIVALEKIDIDINSIDGQTKVLNVQKIEFYFNNVSFKKLI